MANELHHKYITEPAQLQGDGIGLCDGQHWTVHHCIVDFSACQLDEIDEAVGVTWGSSAHFYNCVFRGAGKLVLLGCGDKDKVPVEQGKSVTFEHCLFENFGRRGPEVQDGMTAVLTNCVIRDWGVPERFTERAFGAWAHHGGRIIAQNCVFLQDVNPGLWLWLRDHIGHLGQAINDRGVLGIFSHDAWTSGYRRALTADWSGHVEARHCYADDDLIVEGAGTYKPMDGGDATELIVDIDIMASNLEKELRHAQ